MTARSRCDAVSAAAGAERRRAGHVEVGVVAVGMLLAFAAIVVIRRRVPWIPIVYLVALVSTPVTGWWITRRSVWRRRWRWPAAGVVGLAFIALLPVPTMRMNLEQPPGTAWRLDGRLAINGITIDPPGTWYWLTAGRPPIVAEVVRGWWSTDDAAAPTNMAAGRRAHRPVVAEPAAAAVGLRRAGWSIDDLDVVVGGRLARTPPGTWVRRLALGPSHGLMVALMSYVYASGDDLGVARAIAGTGKIGGDGGVGAIGGLVGKATAARHVGADVLLFPAGQGAVLDAFDPGAMQLCPVASLGEAIDALSRAGRCAP